MDRLEHELPHKTRKEIVSEHLMTFAVLQKIKVAARSFENALYTGKVKLLVD